MTNKYEESWVSSVPYAWRLDQELDKAFPLTGMGGVAHAI